jgi:gamma-glutamyltranspeptidase
VADAIVSTVQELGGVMTHDDLKASHVHLGRIDHDGLIGGITIHEHPPNGQGLTALHRA